MSTLPAAINATPPIQTIAEGTRGASPFSAVQVEVLREKIHILLGQNAASAFVQQEYRIRSDSVGLQIPLLFLAEEIHGPPFSPVNYQAWLDGVPVPLMSVCDDFSDLENEDFGGFSIPLIEGAGYRNLVLVLPPPEPASDGLICREPRFGLKYFEADLSPGEHIVKFTFTAAPCKDLGQTVAKFEYQFLLFPARTWRSQAERELTFESSQIDWRMQSNWGPVGIRRGEAVSHWKIEDQGEEGFSVAVFPEISLLAQFLISLDPFGFFLVGLFVFAGIHLWYMRKARIRDQRTRGTGELLLGGILVPIGAAILGMSSEWLIYSLIPDEIEGIGILGNGVIIFIFSPVVTVPTYLFLMWLVDLGMRWWFRRKFRAGEPKESNDSSQG